MPSEEVPQIVLVGGDKITRRDIGTVVETITESNLWHQSAPISGARIINTWQGYKGVWLVLVKTEAGHYQLFRSTTPRVFTLVHDHTSEIYNLFWLDDGHLLFCAADGWWKTVDTGVTWAALDLGESPPQAKAAASVQIDASTWQLIAYGLDHKIYSAEYPGGEWEEAYDTTAIWADKWYPAIAGGPAGVLAGAGKMLLRSTQAGAVDSWDVVQDDVGGIIKSITVSNQSNKPVFLITVEPTGGEGSQIDRLYLTDDLGDSLQVQTNRVGSISSVQSVIPTGLNTPQTSFAVLGARDSESARVYKIVEV